MHLKIHTPPLLQCSKISHRGCVDFKWSCPLSLVMKTFPHLASACTATILTDGYGSCILKGFKGMGHEFIELISFKLITGMEKRNHEYQYPCILF